MEIPEIQEKVQVVTNYTAPTGSGMALTGMLTFNEWLALAGFGLALGSFLINWYYQHKRYVIERDRK